MQTCKDEIFSKKAVLSPKEDAEDEDHIFKETERKSSKDGWSINFRVKSFV